MDIKTVYSCKNTAKEAVDELSSQLRGFDPKVVIFFASSVYEPEVLSSLMQKSFSSSKVFGCSTAGEIVSGKMLKNSIVAMALNSNVIEDIKIEVVENVREDGDVRNAFKAFSDYYKEPVSDADFNKYVGVILIDGLSASEEKIMDRIGDQTNCTFIGGSAGDDLKFSKTYVYANGAAYTDAAVLALLKPKVGFDIIKTQSVISLDKKLLATKVNTETREVIEFNHKPALQAYAEALEISPDDVPGYFLSNPVGVIADQEIYVRSPRIGRDNNIAFYCNILEGMEVSVLKSTDIVKDTQRAVDNKKEELGGISGIINFHCILRTLELTQKGQMEAYGTIFKDIPTIGFSTYGEEYLGHMNQTSTILVFK